MLPDRERHILRRDQSSVPQSEVDDVGLTESVDVRDVDAVDPVSLIAYDKVMVTVDAVKKFEEMLG